MTDYDQIIREHYISRIRKYTDSHEILDWESRAAQETRFAVLCNRLDISGHSLLDAGCGLGDLFGYMIRSGISCDYTGIDLLGEMIELAQARYRQGHFIHGDMFGQKIFASKSFDIVFSSGIFNLNIGNNETFLRNAMKCLFDIARDYVVFNLLHVKSTDREDRYSYHDPEDISSFLKSFGCKPEIIEGYLCNDFTVFCPVNLSSV